MPPAQRAITFILTFVIAAGCATSSDSTRLSESDTDRINSQVTELNRTWEKFRVSANACTPADATTCFEAAFSSSGFEDAVTDLRAAIGEVGEDVDKGECRSSLDALDAKLGRLSSALDTLQADAEAGNIESIGTTGPAVRSAWDAAVNAQSSSSKVC
jgi:outer membrane murein-binding lipoprotein Lpp